jgi:uracil phosphoribosyltransferase
MASPSLPSNVHVSTHPCLKAKLSLLRSQSTHARDTKQLVHEIATIIGCEALAHGLEVTETGSVSLQYTYIPTAHVTRNIKTPQSPIPTSQLTKKNPSRTPPP